MATTPISRDTDPMVGTAIGQAVVTGAEAGRVQTAVDGSHGRWDEWSRTAMVRLFCCGQGLAGRQTASYSFLSHGS